MVRTLQTAQVVAEISHQINSPLAAIRNAIYLASCRTSDPKLLEYLEVADREIDSITDALRRARAKTEPANNLEIELMELSRQAAA